LIIAFHSLFIFPQQHTKVYAIVLIFLLKLFNFKPEYDSEDDDEEKIMSDFLVKLQSYQLFTLQVRIYNKLLIFAHGIKTNARSPLELRSQINSPVTPDIQTEENIPPILGSYELRGRRVE
jgi:hypothetical protein